MSIDDEILRVATLSRRMVETYLTWGPKRQWGETHMSVYSDVTDFVNFRIETADSCLDLLEKNKVADALGLCRSLLENLLLLKLLCRGDKYFQLQKLDSKTPTEIKVFLAEQQKDLKEKHDKGESLACLYVDLYPRESKALMYVFEGLVDSQMPSFHIPIHFFQFQEFRPATMRLKNEDYFDYYEPPESVREAQKKFKKEALFRYRHFLSYDALIYCLQLNGLLDTRSTSRVEAHYTFLGTFLHPTIDASRNLHERSNWHSNDTAIGMGQTYTKSAILMAHCYVAYLLADILDEIASFYEAAPPLYIEDAGTGDLRAVTAAVSKTIPYFWFIDNEAPAYDRFNHAVNIMTQMEFDKYGDYTKIPSDLIKFDKHVYGNFESGLRGWSNAKAGVYKPPFV